MTARRSRQRPSRAETWVWPTVAGLESATAAEVAAIGWLLPGAIARGTVTLIEGRKGVGKSSVLSALAAAVTGETVLPGIARLPPGQVIWLAGEEHWHSVALPRLLAAGARRERLYRPDVRDSHGRPRQMHLPGDCLILEEAIRQSRAQLVVLDPYISWVSAGIDVRVEQAARQFMEPVSHIAAVTGACIIMSRHLRKGTAGDARDQGLGSTAIGNVAASILRCDEHPSERGVMVLSVVQCRLAQRGPSQAYEIEGGDAGMPRVLWRGEVGIDADEIAEGRGSEAERDEWSDADRLLAEVIGSGWISVGDILREADGAGLSPRTVRRSKARLKIPSRRTLFGDAGHWEWGPPPGGWPPGICPSAPPQGGTRVDVAPLATLDGRAGKNPKKPAKVSKVAKGATLPRVPPQSNGTGADHAQ